MNRPGLAASVRAWRARHRVAVNATLLAIAALAAIGMIVAPFLLPVAAVASAAVLVAVLVLSSFGRPTP